MIRAGFSPTAAMSANVTRAASSPSASSSQAGVARAEHGQHGLIPGDARTHEGEGAGQERLLAGIQQGLVMEQQPKL